jgi:hypothetical protein
MLQFPPNGLFQGDASPEKYRLCLIKFYAHANRGLFIAEFIILYSYITGKMFDSMIKRGRFSISSSRTPGAAT